MTTGRRRWARSARAALRSPGRPPVARRERRPALWAAIAAGRSSEDAAVEAGASPPVGARWFREAGGMPPSRLAPLGQGRRRGGLHRSSSGRRLRVSALAGTAYERSPAGSGGRPPRSPAGCAATRPGEAAAWSSRATTAQWRADRSARRPKPAKPAVNARLREHAQDRLAGRTADGRRPGARSGSRAGSGPTFPRTRPCASATKPSARRSTRRGAAR